MNFYSNDIFCQAIQATYFPDGRVAPALFELDGKIWKIPTLNSQQPITKFPIPSSIIDFYEPYPQALIDPHHQIQTIDYIPQVSHGLVSIDEWFERELEQTYLPAPTIIWDRFKSWEEFVKHVRKKRSNLFAEYRRCLRKLGEEVGSITFIFDDPRTEMLETCIAWKSAQLMKNNTVDFLTHQEHVQYFRELHKLGLLMVSTLSAGDRPISIAPNILEQGRFHGLICAYDLEYSTYAPGRLELILLLEESFKQKHQEFDFMVGNESYKWWFATHTRLVSELGNPPISTQIGRSIESSVQPLKKFIKTTLVRMLPLIERVFPSTKKNVDLVLYKIRQKLYNITKHQ